MLQLINLNLPLSVMQVLFTIPNFQDQYVKAATEIFESTNFDNTGM